MVEIIYSAQSATVKNAYREGANLLLLDGCSLPDICVACGNPASGNVERREFSKVSSMAVPFAASSRCLLQG